VGLVQRLAQLTDWSGTEEMLNKQVRALRRDVLRVSKEEWA